MEGLGARQLEGGDKSEALRGAGEETPAVTVSS